MNQKVNRIYMYVFNLFPLMYNTTSRHLTLSISSPRWKINGGNRNPGVRRTTEHIDPMHLRPWLLGLASSGSESQWCDMDHSTNKKNVDIIQPLQIRTTKENKGDILWVCYISKITVHG